MHRNSCITYVAFQCVLDLWAAQQSSTLVEPNLQADRCVDPATKNFSLRMTSGTGMTWGTHVSRSGLP